MQDQSPSYIGDVIARLEKLELHIRGMDSMSGDAKLLREAIVLLSVDLDESPDLSTEERNALRYLHRHGCADSATNTVVSLAERLLKERASAAIQSPEAGMTEEHIQQTQNDCLGWINTHISRSMLVGYGPEENHPYPAPGDVAMTLGDELTAFVLERERRLTTPPAPSAPLQEVTEDEMRRAVELLGERILNIKMTMSQHREFARAILSLLVTRSAPSQWRPSDPEDDSIRLCGLWVANNRTGLTTWDQFIACQDEDGDAVTPDGDDIGWRWSELMVTDTPTPPAQEPKP